LFGLLSLILSKQSVMNILSIIVLGLQDKLEDAKDLRRYDNAILNIKAASAAAAVGIALFALILF
jgi:hypothetical protein